MPLKTNREIPFNYTSADDAQIVTFLMGAPVWHAIEKLHYRKMTGRLLRLILRFIGDLFLLHRNPFVFQDMIDNAARRHRFLESARSDMNTIRSRITGTPEGDRISRACSDAFGNLEKSLRETPEKRRWILQAIGPIIGPENVRFDPFSLISHATDATDWRLHLPVAVFYPSSAAQIPALIPAIQRLDLRVIPRGAGTGLTGGCIPATGDCVMLNLEKLNRIHGISTRDIRQADGTSRETAVIRLEAGVITEDAIRAAAAQGLVFATDPTSAWACTIGGNIAENAGGKTAVLWGTAIDNLLSFEMVTPDGQSIEVRRRHHPAQKIHPDDIVEFEVTGGKNRAARIIRLGADEIRKPGLGKDITNKALGGVPGIQKEGCDGIITDAEFILYPAYPHLMTVCLEFFGEDMDEAGRVIVDISRRFVNRGKEALMALEHFDEEYVKAIDYVVKAPVRQRPKAVLLIDIVGHTAEQIEQGKQILVEILEPYPRTYLTAAGSREEGVRFWKDRKRLGAIARRTHAFKLNEDIVLPLDMLAEFSAFVDAANIEENRYNQKTVVWQTAAVIDSLRSAEKDPWMSAKLDEARKLCMETLDLVDLSGKEHLQEETHLKRMRNELDILFSSVDGIMAEFDRITAEIRKRLIVIATHMHAGDGNVHVNIPVFSNDRDMMTRAAETADSVMAEAVELGGVVSGEHGIGITKFKYLSAEKLADFTAYRNQADPGRLMNPGKLEDPNVPGRAFATSFNLLGLEAHILRYGSLEKLAAGISGCVRCGKCKPNCCVFYPAGNLFFHPRNKNLAINSLIEALLYDAQRSHTARFEMLRYLREIADHCTICHKCLGPCPVHIDTGDITVLEREILQTFGVKKIPLVTRTALGLLESRSRTLNRLFRRGVLQWGTRAQRIVGRLIASAPPLPEPIRKLPLYELAANPLPAPPTGRGTDAFPMYGRQELIQIEPPESAVRTVFYFPGCGSERLYPAVAQAAIYLMLKHHTRVILPPRFLCCGFPSLANAASDQHNRLVLRDTIIFHQIRDMLGHMVFDACAVTCGTCRESLARMDLAGIFEAPIRDVSDLLVSEARLSGPGNACLYHTPCHDSLEGTGMTLLQAARYRPVDFPHCCAEAGTLAVSSPDIARAMRERKQESLTDIRHSREKSRIILTNCPACLQGLGRLKNSLPVRHIAEDLALAAGGARWKTELKQLLTSASVVRF